MPARNTKRVLFVAPSAYPLGGVAVWLDYLASGLPDHSWQPQIGLVSGKWHDISRYRAAYPRLPAIAIDNPTGSAEGRRRALMRAIEQAKPNIVVGVNIADLYRASRRLRARGRQVRTVLALHGIAADLLDDLKRESVWLDAVIATNRLACRLCIEYAGMPVDRVFYAPYGVDQQALAALPRPDASEMLNIAWVGRLEQEQKRVESISPLLDELDRSGIAYKLRIAGDGPESASLLRVLRPWIEMDRVEYLGALTAKDVGRKVYAQSDVFLLTSSWETGPIVIWEAMATSVAVVSSRYIGSGLEGALRHEDNCLLFEVDDAVGAAEQITRLRDIELRGRLIVSGRRLVAERYSVEHSVSAWANCLDGVMQLPLREVDAKWGSPPTTGRLDRLLGVTVGETVRRVAGIRFSHEDPGGEWPHTNSSNDEKLLLDIAARLDVSCTARTNLR